MGNIRTNQRDVESQFIKRFLLKQYLTDWRNLLVHNFITEDGTDITLGRLFSEFINPKAVGLLNWILSADMNLSGTLAARNSHNLRLLDGSEELTVLDPQQHPTSTHAFIPHISRSNGVLLPTAVRTLPSQVTFPQCANCGHHVLSEDSDHVCPIPSAAAAVAAAAPVLTRCKHRYCAIFVLLRSHLHLPILMSLSSFNVYCRCY